MAVVPVGVDRPIMSAALAGGKRSFDLFEEFANPAPCKRSRRGYLPPAAPEGDKNALLLSHSPTMDQQLIESTLEDSSYDIESATERLRELCICSTSGSSGTPKDKLVAGTGASAQAQQEDFASKNRNTTCQNLFGADNLPVVGSELVEPLVNELLKASTSTDDASAIASRVLGLLEEHIRTQANAEATKNLEEENITLKEQANRLVEENNILKQAFGIQNERMKEHEKNSQELQHLKQLIPRYQEKARDLEVNNEAMSTQLRQLR